MRPVLSGRAAGRQRKKTGRKTLTSQILLRTFWGLGLVGLVTTLVLCSFTKVELDSYLNEEVSSTKVSILDSMESTQASTKIIEQMIDQRLLYASQQIARELHGQTIDQVTPAELKQLCYEWNLYNLSLMVQKPDGQIVIQKSSDPKEVGLNTSDWGYFDTAVRQLFAGKMAQVEKGYAEPHYWAGPISISDWEDKYFKYAYYYDGTTDFMIDPYVADQEIYHLTFEAGPTQMIEKVLNENSSIEEIGVLNVPAYLRGKDNHVQEPDRDTPVLYGRYTDVDPQDQVVLKRLMQGGAEESVKFARNGRHLIKYYIPLENQRVMVIVANFQRQEDLQTRFSTLLSIAFFLAFVVIFVMIRVIARRQLKPIAEIDAYLQRVSNGELTSRLEIHENNELGFLAEKISDMAEKIGSLIQEANMRAKEKIAHMAYHDDLTNLPNRRLFIDRLVHALDLARRNNHRLAVIFLDLDRFKNVNDSLGHAAGDRLLQGVAKRLTECVPDGDTLARMGGDEFTLLMPVVDQIEEVSAFAGKILNALEQPILFEEHEFHVTTSLGIAVFPQDGDDVVSLLKNADTAMYSAKEQGRNNFQFYTPTMNAMILEQLQMEQNLRRALENQEFALYYQPQVNMSTGEIVGVEALIRWVHPTDGLISPGHFIPLAESTGLIVPIGEWVLKTACLQAKAWQDAGYKPLRMAVNLSALQFEQQCLVHNIATVLEETGLDPQYLELEITESLAMKNADRAIDKLHALKQIGVQLSIDDFGTGYSSLGYLKKFPIDTLKIDRSFVGDITDDSDDAAIVTAILAMAHNLKINVVAEGVETKEQFYFLRQQACDELQGYLFSRPVPAPDLEEMLRKGKRMEL